MAIPDDRFACKAVPGVIALLAFAAAPASAIASHAYYFPLEVSNAWRSSNGTDVLIFEVTGTP